MPKKKKAKKSKPTKAKARSKPKKKSIKKRAVKTSAKTAKAKSSIASSASKRAGLVPLAPKAPVGNPGEKFLGKVEDFFRKISVVALTVKDTLSIGDAIHVHGHTTDFTEEVKSMQMDHKPIKTAKRRDSVGIKVGDKARKGDNVFRVG